MRVTFSYICTTSDEYNCPNSSEYEGTLTSNGNRKIRIKRFNFLVLL